MKTETDLRTGPITLTAPVAGMVRFCAPPALCGELDVFQRGDAIAHVGGVSVEAPDQGFMLRAFVADGSHVEQAAPIASYRTV